MNSELLLRTIRTIPLLFVLGLCTCGRGLPTVAQGPQVDPEMLEQMRVVAVEWPDTMVVGERATASVEVVLPNGIIHQSGGVAWRSLNPDVAGLSPTSVQEAKRVIAFSEGVVQVRVLAYTSKVPYPETSEDYYLDTLILPILVLPTKKP